MGRQGRLKHLELSLSMPESLSVLTTAQKADMNIAFGDPGPLNVFRTDTNTLDLKQASNENRVHVQSLEKDKRLIQQRLANGRC